jgi:hypothetical protein
MAPMKKQNLFCHLAASSMVEVVVATVILMLVFGMGLGICLSLTKHTAGLPVLKAQQAVQDYTLETICNHAYFDQTRELEDARLQRKIIPQLPNRQLLLLEIRYISASDSTLCLRKQLIYAPADP